MKRKHKGTYRRVCALLEDSGVRKAQYEIRKTKAGHFRLRILVGCGALYFFPSTPSDHRSMKNTLTGVRRALCEARERR